MISMTVHVPTEKLQGFLSVANLGSVQILIIAHSSECFLGKTVFDEINCVHKRVLVVLLKDLDASFEELFQKNEEITIHVKNLQKPMLKVNECFTFGKCFHISATILSFY